MKTRLLRRASAGALALTLIGAPLAYADNLEADGDGLTPVTDKSLALGNVCAGETIAKDILLAVSRNGNGNVFKDASTVKITVLSVSSGLGLSAAVEAPGTISMPSNWGALANNVMSPALTSHVTLVAGPTARTLPVNTTITYRAEGVGDDNKPLNRDASLSVSGSVINCNTPPQIQVNDATLEGDTLGGRTLTFSDIGTAVDAEDGAPAVSCVPAIGSVLPLGPTSVTCTATDKGLATKTDSGNVTVVDTIAPSIFDVPGSTSVEATSASGATVTYTAPTASDVVWGAVSPSCAPVSGSTFPLGPSTVTCTATDGSGNRATATFAVNVHDTTAPRISVTDVEAEGNALGGANVDFSLPTATDLVDGATAVTCDHESGDFFALGDNTVNCESTDSADNTSNASFIVTVVDTTAPDMMTSDVVAEGNTSNGANVDFALPTATDIVDGATAVTCDFVSGDFFPLGTTTVKCSSTDKSDNRAQAEFSVTVEDTQAPTLVGMPSDVTIEGNTAGGALYSYAAPTATDIVDPHPTVSCVPSPSSFFSLGDTKVTCSATDASDNSASEFFVVTVEDTTAPAIADLNRTPAANLAGWNNTSVTVSWTCSDIVSGVVQATGSATVSTEGANQSATATCTDNAGNTATSPVSGINIDKTAPGIEWSGGPQDGATYYYGTLPTAPTCAATDSLSGADGCVVEGYDPAFGSHTMKATARDKAGNTTTEERTYTYAQWRTSGFYAPVDMNGVWNTVKGGATVPLKFELFAGAAELTDTSAIKSFTATPVTCGTTTDEDLVEITTTGKTALRYDTVEGKFIQNWQTPKMPGTCYQTTMTAQDGSKITAYFKLK